MAASPLKKEVAQSTIKTPLKKNSSRKTSKENNIISFVKTHKAKSTHKQHKANNISYLPKPIDEEIYLTHFEDSEEGYEEDVSFTSSDDFNAQPAQEDIIKTSKKDHADFEDTIQIYLDEIYKYKLLTKEEEIALSKRIQQGDDDALNSLIKANLRLVIHIAKQYSSSDYAFTDLIQDGNMGLLRAAKKFDYRKGARFSTYASWWIKQTIIRNLTIKRNLIRLPHRKEESLRKVKKIFNQFYQEHKRYPNEEELASCLKLTTAKLKKILGYSTTVLSLENEVSDDNLRIGNILSDNQYNPDSVFFSQALQDEIQAVLNTLYPKERDILNYRFGFVGGNKKVTLKHLGKKFGLAAETVRQIEIKALKKLKENYPNLKEFITDAE